MICQYHSHVIAECFKNKYHCITVLKMFWLNKKATQQIYRNIMNTWMRQCFTGDISRVSVKRGVIPVRNCHYWHVEFTSFLSQSIDNRRNTNVANFSLLTFYKVKWNCIRPISWRIWRVEGFTIWMDCCKRDVTSVPTRWVKSLLNQPINITFYSSSGGIFTKPSPSTITSPSEKQRRRYQGRGLYCKTSVKWSHLLTPFLTTLYEYLTPF